MTTDRPAFDLNAVRDVWNRLLGLLPGARARAKEEAEFESAFNDALMLMQWNPQPDPTWGPRIAGHRHVDKMLRDWARDAQRETPIRVMLDGDDIASLPPDQAREAVEDYLASHSVLDPLLCDCLMRFYGIAYTEATSANAGKPWRLISQLSS